MFLQLCAQRFSLRQYAQRPVDRAAIDRCCEAARLAPSACNSQPWHFIILNNEPERSMVARLLVSSLIGLNKFALQAPVIACVVSDTGNLNSRIGGFLKRKPFHLIDIGIAAGHFCLQAAEEGLGTCILGWFNDRAVARILGIARPRRIPLAITLGYPPDSMQIPEKSRKSLDAIRTFLP